MSYKPFAGETPYSKMVVDCVNEWSLAVVGELDVTEFARMCGFSVTHNLRRRIANLVEHQVLQSRYAMGEDGRWRWVYQPTESYRAIIRMEKTPF